MKKETHKKKAIAAMQALGTYRKEFEDLISIYADLREQYDEALEKWYQEGKAFEVETATGSTKKSGTVSAMEILRRDILTYSDRLGLSPKALESIDAMPAVSSPLAELIAELRSDDR